MILQDVNRTNIHCSAELQLFVCLAITLPYQTSGFVLGFLLLFYF